MVLISLLVGPCALIGLGYAVTRSEYINNASIARDQPVPFSHEHHVADLDSTAVTAMPGSNVRRSQACRPRIRA
jgi:hypothetical protein